MNIMEKARGERLILLYQHLPKGEKNAKTLSALLSLFNPTGDKAKSRAKLLEQDLLALFSLFGDNSICRIPAWSDGLVTGKTPKYYLHTNFSLDSFDNENLFFWEMLDKFTAHYLPKTIHNTLTTKISNVKNHQLKQYQISQLGQWKNHILTLPSVLNAPKLDETILSIIHQAIIEQKALIFDYCRKWEATPEQKTVYPVGLVFIDNMVYLTGFYAITDNIAFDEQDYLKQHRNFAVTRISQATVSKQPIPTWVKTFNLDYLHHLGTLQYYITHRGKPITLKLKINQYACQHLQERPLSDNQTLEQLDDENLLLTATVMNTVTLEDWLVSMSHMSEVFAPLDLRQAVIERLQGALRYYQ